MTEINSLIKDLLHALGVAASIAVENSADEGDRAYFGSTNDLDALRDAVRAYHDYQFRTGDYGDEGEFEGGEE